MVISALIFRRLFQSDFSMSTGFSTRKVVAENFHRDFVSSIITFLLPPLSQTRTSGCCKGALTPSTRRSSARRGGREDPYQVPKTDLWHKSDPELHFAFFMRSSCVEQVILPRPISLYPLSARHRREGSPTTAGRAASNPGIGSHAGIRISLWSPPSCSLGWY